MHWPPRDDLEDESFEENENFDDEDMNFDEDESF